MNRRFTALSWSLLLGTAAVLFGCGGDSTSPVNEPVPPLVSGTIGAGGGELIHDDVVLTVPDGALDDPADLAIYPESGDHPLGGDAAPVYRIEGLPQELGTPVTLRFRHGLVPAASEALTCFLGEQREAYSGGGGRSWYRTAGRDSAGWAIVEMERGALDLETKDEGDVQATATVTWTWLSSDAEHFEVGFDPTEVSRDRASELLTQCDQMYDAFTAWGFDFGDPEIFGDIDIWPLDVNIRTPVKSTACYVAAPYGAGFFEIDPAYLEPGVETLPVVAHEMFHCVQSFYDPRDPEQWGVLNQERLWLDEATASYLEALTVEAEDACPVGLDDDNYAALLAGIAGHPDLANNEYGYGMVQFIAYLVDFANEEEGEDQLLEIFQHFKTGGDVTDAIDAVISPPVTSWCVDMHRKFALNQIYPAFPVHWFWHQWGFGGYLDGDIGATETGHLTVPDLGADICKFVLEGDAPEGMSGLAIAARGADPDLSIEELVLSIYGRALNEGLTLLATGVDELMIEDWPTLYDAYEEIYVMVSRPYSTAPGHTGRREIEVTAAVIPDLSGLDVTAFNGASIEVRTDVLFSNSNSGVFGNYLIGVQADVSWTGSALQCATSTDTFSITVNPETFALGSWYGSEHYTSIGGNWIVKRLAGHGGLQLTDWDENGVIYRVSNTETCDYLGRVYESSASDSHTAPYRYSLSWSCSDGEFPWDQSGIYIHLFRMP